MDRGFFQGGGRGNGFGNGNDGFGNGGDRGGELNQGGGQNPFNAEIHQLEAAQRFYPGASAQMQQYVNELFGAPQITNQQQQNTELNGISQGLQQIEQQNQGNPHNGLVGTVVNELNDYITAHGGTPGPTPGGGCGGGTPA